MIQTTEKIQGIAFGSCYTELSKLNGFQKILGTTSLISKVIFLGEEWLITYNCNENSELEIGSYSMSKKFSSMEESVCFIKRLKNKFVNHENLSAKNIVDIKDGYESWKRNKLLMSFSFLSVVDNNIDSNNYSFSIVYEYQV